MKRILAVGIIALFMSLFTPSPANAEEGCLINVLGVKVCGTLLDQPLPPVVTVTVKPDPIKIRIPGPTVTLPPVKVPGPTVNVPGPTVTVTAPPKPTQTKTKTVTVRPAPVGPSKLPRPTKTVTTGQTASGSGTVTASPTTEIISTHSTDTRTVFKRAVLGTVATLVLVALGIAALFMGYIIGHRDAEADERKFIGSMVAHIKRDMEP